MIPAGAITVPFNISIFDDNILEGDEDFDITIIQSSLPDGVSRGNPGTATVNIVDDDRKYRIAGYFQSRNFRMRGKI